MKIRVALLSEDRVYSERLSEGFGSRYFDKVEVACFTRLESAKTFFETNAVHVFLAEEGMNVTAADVPDRCAFAVLTRTKQGDKQDGVEAVAKYQRLEVLYKAILNLYDRKFEGRGISVSGDRETRLFTFASPAGGCGSSTAAAAFAVRLAGQGRRVLYLNCELFGSAEQFFPEGETGLPELLFAIKSRKGSGIDLKLETMASRSPEGVFTVRSFQSPVDLFSVTGEDAALFAARLRETGQYDAVVFDTVLIPSEPVLALAEASDALVCTLDGSRRANEKMRRAFEELRRAEERRGKPLTDRVRVLYSRVIRGAEYGSGEWTVLGTIPRLEGDTAQKLKHIAGEAAFDGLMKG